MGTIRNGANGGFSGKAGSVVGSSWNKINYIKGLSKISKKAATLGQIDQRLRFAVASKYLGPIKDILNLGFKGQTEGRTTGSNMAVRYALTEAIVGTYPDYSIDKSKVLISKGTLTVPADAIASCTVAEQLHLSWFFNSSVKSNSESMTDQLAVVIYNEVRDYYLSYEEVAIRNDREVDIAIPSNFSGQEVFVYAFFVAANKTRQSRSIYLGGVTII